MITGLGLCVRCKHLRGGTYTCKKQGCAKDQVWCSEFDPQKKVPKMKIHESK